MPTGQSRRVCRLALVVFLAAALSLAACERLRRPAGRAHLVRPPSEALIQTLSVRDLARQPFQSLWYLHIQPPVFDALRTVIVLSACRRCARYRDVVRCTDAGLLHVWVVAYAATAMIVFVWLARLTGRIAPGLLGAALFALHPGSIFYASYLDSTCLSALLVTWFSYELWLVRDAASGSTWRLAAVTILLFLTRSAFQWPFLLAVAAALLLRGWSLRRVAVYCAIAGTAIAAYLVKQFALFGLLVTSSFIGLNGCHALGRVPAPWPDALTPSADGARGVSALDRVYKPNGRPNYNHQDYLRVARTQLAEFRAALATQPASETAAALLRNGRVYVQPSSQYGRQHRLVDILPWRRPFEAVFSGVPLLALVVGATGFWWWRATGRRRALVGMALPVAYLVLTCVAGERRENMRYKHFLEPTVIVLFVASGHFALRTAMSLRGRRGADPGREPAAV